MRVEMAAQVVELGEGTVGLRVVTALWVRVTTVVAETLALATVVVVVALLPPDKEVVLAVRGEPVLAPTSRDQV
jgi:hypothetical protein